MESDVVAVILATYREEPSIIEPGERGARAEIELNRDDHRQLRAWCEQRAAGEDG